ncbi:MAG: PHB depolymerase family esterase [Pyrinomonadaceae bacterium]
MKNDFSKLFSGFLGSAFSGEKQGEIVSRDIFLDGEDYIYQAYLPPQIKQNEKLPLVVFLHGIRERGTGGYISGMFGTVIKQYLKEIPAVVLLPQCLPNVYWTDAKMDAMVMRQTEAITNEFSIDEKRKYLMGVSMGGYGVWHLASNYPNDFAALVSICGGSPLTSGNRFAPIAENIGKTPAWLFHGADDNIVQVSESRNLTAAIRANNGNVKYSEYENVGHNVWLNALGEKELLPWLLAQKK